MVGFSTGLTSYIKLKLAGKIPCASGRFKTALSLEVSFDLTAKPPVGDATKILAIELAFANESVPVESVLVFKAEAKLLFEVSLAAILFSVVLIFDSRSILVNKADNASIEGLIS